MIISVNWLKKFTDIDMPIDELTTLIGARLVEIEKVTNLGPKYNKAVIVKVVSCEPVEGSDHLHVTKIDDGGVTENVERDQDGLVQVVCGAPNVRAGLTAVWLTPGATVPNSVNDVHPFVLDVRELRGIKSNGMLASAKELDLFDDHSGILELDDSLLVGTSLTEAYELDDYLLDIENKSLTHRPDTFGIIGFAREIAGILGTQFTTPDWLALSNPHYDDMNTTVATPTVIIDEPDIADRYQAVVVENSDGTKQTPVMIQTYLSRVGVRPVGAVVDVTNMLMMVSGQPLHAFDYDKLLAVGGGKADIHVRSARAGETLELLDGHTIQLDPSDIVIAAGETAISLAGAMGGKSTMIDDSTKRIIVESATFNLYRLRTTQMRHGIFSEAITRFTKGQPAALTAPVLSEVVRVLQEWTGATRASEVADAKRQDSEIQAIELSAESIRAVLGIDIPNDTIISLLQNVEFKVTMHDDTVRVIAPYWRSDIHIAEDIIEEVGRLNGYDSIHPTLPTRDFRAVQPTTFDTFRALVRHTLCRAGASEILTYSFVHGDILQKVGQDMANSYRITNSISPDLQYYRQSLTPSILGCVNPNSRQGYSNFGLYELNKVHLKSDGLSEENVPVERDNVAFTITNSDPSNGTSYYQAKFFLEYLSQQLGIQVSYQSYDQSLKIPMTLPFEPRRSALVTDNKGTTLGVVGEYKQSIVKASKLSSLTAGFELDTRALFELYQARDNSYQPLSKYPSSERDICFQVSTDQPYGAIITATQEVLKAIPSLHVTVTPLDIYQAENATTKNITIRLQFTATDRTLTGEEVRGYVDQVAERVISLTHATVV